MNPVAFTIGPLSIHWYSITMFLAFLLGSLIALKEAKRTGLNVDFLIDLIFYLVPISIVGARIYYVIFNFSIYQNNLLDIFKMWEGGLAIHGGILAGLLWIIYYCRKKKVYIFRVTDILVPALILGQAIGRWGNFFNGEAYGNPISLSRLQSLHLPQFIIDGMNINGTYFQPTFFYESMWCLIGFILLMFLRKRKNIKLGILTTFYLIWYSFERFFVEGFRSDSLFIGNLKVAQVVSLILFVVGIVMVIRIIFLSKKEYKYNEKGDLDESRL